MRFCYSLLFVLGFLAFSQIGFSQVITSSSLHASHTTVSNSEGSIEWAIGDLVYSFCPTVKVSPDTAICQGTPLELSASLDLNLTWEVLINVPQVIGIGSSLNVTPFTTSLYRAYLGGCESASDSVLVTVNNPPRVDLGTDLTTCVESVNISAGIINPEYTYLWSTGETTRSINITTTGVFSVDVSNACGLTKDAISVTFKTPPVLNLGSDTVSCDGPVVLVAGDNTSGNNYLWSTGVGTSLLNVTKTGIYSVSVSNECGASTDMIQVFIKSRPSINLGSDFVACEDKVVLKAGDDIDGDNYYWSTGETKNSITVTKPGDYFVELINECGKDQDSISISFINDVFIPNVITPNDDNRNDKFIINTLNPASIELEPSLYIYNRWGRLVYSDSNYTNNWPLNPDVLSSGNYFYLVDFPGCRAFKGVLQILSE